MQAPENGSGVYYQPGSDQSPKALATEKQKDKSGPSATSSTADQPKQPQAVNPDSRYRSSEAKPADQEDQEYEYYPEDASSRSAYSDESNYRDYKYTNSAYSDESNYRDYKYTNRIRRFESDWNRPYFDQPYNRRFSGYSSYGNRAYYDNPGGLSLRVTSTSTGFFNDPYYSGFGPYGSRFNPFYGYRQGFNDGFYSSRYRTYSPYGTFGYNRFQPGYHTPVGFYSNNNQSADGDDNKTMALTKTTGARAAKRSLPASGPSRLRTTAATKNNTITTSRSRIKTTDLIRPNGEGASALITGTGLTGITITGLTDLPALPGVNGMTQIAGILTGKSDQLSLTVLPITTVTDSARQTVGTGTAEAAMAIAITA
jgi:hypothetical protein